MSSTLRWKIEAMEFLWAFMCFKQEAEDESILLTLKWLAEVLI